MEYLNFFPSLLSPTDTTGAKSLDTAFHALQAKAPNDLKPRLKGLDQVMDAAIKDPSKYNESAYIDAKIKVEDWGQKYCS
ncbi:MULTISPECIES: hypothetical protein [unclassified Tersicoccus]|uniref:hypothetical protein n=1 Tax=Tersicoccus TaxID=1418588 RepID=UPI00117DB2A5|nr:hypothetical protein [Tersicoccus sp. Bi-70]